MSAEADTYPLQAPELADRIKDRVFCTAMLVHGHVRLAEVLPLVATMPLDDARRSRLRATIRRWAQAARDQGHEVPED